MHQLANAVIIFDEVQTIPVRCVHLFNLAVRFLVQGCGSTVVLCTATQPLLDQVEPQYRSLVIKPENHLIPDEKELFEKLRRVNVFDGRKAGGWGDKEVVELAAEELGTRGNLLIIVNTKKAARSLFQMISGKKLSYVFHLSTNMCPAHRLKVLNVVKKMLEKKKPVVCISTQLVEAGVDIDFNCVIRYLAGIDSIGQAAGRCNRNGRMAEYGKVWVVNPSDESLDRLRDIRLGAEKAERVLDDYENDPPAFDEDRIGLKAIEAFYRYYFYERQDEMCYKIGKESPVGREDNLFNLLAENSAAVAEHERVYGIAPNIPLKQSFQTAAKAFQVIDSATQGVVVPYKNEGKEIIADLCSADEIEKQYGLLKKAQRYSVNLFPHEIKKLVGIKAIHEVQEGAGIYSLDEQYYSNQFGWNDEIVNEMPTYIY